MSKAIIEIIEAISSGLAKADPEKLQKAILGSHKSGEPRSVYDVMKANRKAKQKELKALTDSSKSSKKKKKKKKGKKDFKYGGYYHY